MWAKWRVQTGPSVEWFLELALPSELGWVRLGTRVGLIELLRGLHVAVSFNVRNILKSIARSKIHVVPEPGDGVGNAVRGSNVAETVARIWRKDWSE